LRPASAGNGTTELHRSFEKTVSVTMRQTHAAGERLFVDYAACLHRHERRVRGRFLERRVIDVAANAEVLTTCEGWPSLPMIDVEGNPESGHGYILVANSPWPS
jgi:hypothetical protein